MHLIFCHDILPADIEINDVHFVSQVCQGDRIVVDVQNNMAGSEVTIHWHGLWQRGTQYMDGVPMLTQCPIHEGQTFRYDFIANNPGTHYYHSHTGKNISRALDHKSRVRFLVRLEEVLL